MKKQSKKARARRYKAALIEILGQSWRKWWLDQPSKDRINRVTVDSTHRKKLERMEKDFEQPSRSIDLNRRAEKSFRHCDKCFKYSRSLLMIGFIFLVSFIWRIAMWYTGTKVDTTIELTFIGVWIVLGGAFLYLSTLVFSLGYPTDTTQYVGAEWRDFRTFLIKSGLIKGVTQQLMLKYPNLLEELEYSAERGAVDTEVSNAIHDAYRRHIINLIVEELKLIFKKAEKEMKRAEYKTITINIFEAGISESIDSAPIFFVPHNPKEFRLIVYKEAFEQSSS